VAALSGAPKPVRVVPAPSSRLPADEPLIVDPAIDPASDGVHALIGSRIPATHARPAIVEIVVDGWRFELEVEDDARARLRERATRDPGHAAADGPLEIRAIIPGRVVSVAVNVEDAIEAGQPLLILEAMKMQNELRSPRAGRITRVAASAGQTVEIGDVLVVLE
jgi:biotin carboxyl carrier protein